MQILSWHVAIASALGKEYCLVWIVSKLRGKTEERRTARERERDREKRESKKARKRVQDI